LDKTTKPKNGRRKPPADMPREVETIRRNYLQTPKRDLMPAQKALSDVPEVKPPAKWKAVARKLLLLLLLLLALAFLYLFLLMGEPDDDDEMLLKQSAAQEEIIRMPMTGQEMTGTVDVTAAAVSFGKDVMELRGNALPLIKAALYDTAYNGGYARRLTLTYQFPDGSEMTVDSIRPPGAITLLTDSQYALRVDTLYTMGGLDAVRMDSEDYIRVAAAGEDAVYVMHIPVAKEEQLSDYLRTLGLIRTDGQ
jgi:hypothetical protein